MFVCYINSGTLAGVKGSNVSWSSVSQLVKSFFKTAFCSNIYCKHFCVPITQKDSVKYDLKSFSIFSIPDYFQNIEIVSRYFKILITQR